MKTSSFARIVLFTAALLTVTSSCQKPSRKGKAINFTVSIVNDLGTKTAYGNLNTGGNHQAIEWTSGDQITLYSDNTAVAATENGGNSATYTIVEDGSDPSLANLAKTAGLRWNEVDGVTFHGVYPAGTTSSGLGLYTMNIPWNQSHSLGATTTASGGMVAKQYVDGGSSEVHLDFYPAFTAFEIHLKNQESTELTLTSFAIKTDASNSYYLTGEYSVDWTSSSMSFTPTANVYKLAEYTFPSGTTITDTKEVVFNLFLLPVSLSELYLEINYQNELGQARTRKLQLKLNDSYISFPACKKHIINGLALDSGEFWKMEVNGSTLEWNEISQTINEEVSISTKVAISGAIESTAQWKGESSTHTKGNHYADSYWVDQDNPGYGTGAAPNYDKNYQIRTLNKDLPASQRFFTLTFTPAAPTGGYWQLIPLYKEDDVQSPNHFRFERDLPGGGTTDELKGQILNQPETIRIYPVNWDPSDVNTYNVWFTCRFSTTPTFSHSINADSEFQDVHGDGRFSYWVFRLKQYSNVYPTD